VHHFGFHIGVVCHAGLPVVQKGKYGMAASVAFRWVQIDLVHKKALTVGKSKTEAGGECKPESYVFPAGKRAAEWSHPPRR
jgi:hypothetical protein